MKITLTRATRSVSLCVNADLYAAWQAAGDRLKRAQAAAKIDAREVNSAVTDAASEQVRLESEMLAHTVRFTLQAMRRGEWAAFTAKHPPREGDELDGQFGVDVSALDAAIIAMCTAVLGPDDDPVEGFVMAEHWEALADEMAQPQWEPFATAVLMLNQGEGSAAVPFSLAASREMRRSGRS